MSFEVNYEEDLVSRIQDLVDEYSKDSILKEYLQNADDSGATELVVTFDKRRHESLKETKFEAGSGLALLLSNNSQFKENDFKAIVKISAKGKARDAYSTGRFGQGFSSSFSISDHPSFVSNGKAYWFDVLKKAVSKNKDRSIQGWELEREGNKDVLSWLDAFSIDDNYINGTVFRLPLRDESTASLSDISHEIFGYNDFLRWCDEWKSNTEGLLFLRHVQKLVLQEINSNGDVIKHVEIKTKNSGEIQKYNNDIQKEFSGDLIGICNKWNEQDFVLPFHKYKHHFLIKQLDRETKNYEESSASWAVVNGLFRGKNNQLIHQSIKVLNIYPNRRKVLPWAGVAIPINEKGKVVKNTHSNYYTFLALPIKSKHPLHIHGWFDLNSKRTQITFDGKGDDKETLIEWNNLLFEQGVGVAWAYLIDYIKELCPANKYYDLWPKNNDDEFDEYLLTGFYNKISELKCFKTRHKNTTQWNTPKDDIYYLQRGLDKNLFNAFREHFYLIALKPNQNIIDGLTDIEVGLQEIEPKFIREFLLEEAAKVDFPISLNNVPIKMLSQKKYFLAILIFCAEAEKDKNYSLLEELLPLELASNYELNQLGRHCLVAEMPNVKIFNGDKSLFIDSEIVEIVKDAEVLPSYWLQSTLKNYLLILHEHIDEYNLNDKQWLKAVIKLIKNAGAEQIEEALEELHTLQVVYQHNNSFGYLKPETGSPVLVSKEEEENISLLAKTGMTLVHSDYIDIYSPLLQYQNLITNLSSFSLIKHLVHIPENEYGFFKEQYLREYLVDLIAQDISWFDQLSDNELELFNDMPFISTESGNLFSAKDDKKLFLPAGFNPPESIHSLKGEYELIKVVNEKQRVLFENMGFEEQNPINYLEKIIIPFIGSSPSVDDVKKILEWLANEWEQLITDIDKEEKDNLISKLSGSTIILDSSNKLKIAKNYYHPHFFSKLPLFLQNKKYSPLRFEFDKTQHNWKKLLSLLGASTEILPQHVVDTVQSISEEHNHKQSIELLNYISKNFECFDSMQCQGKDIFEYLSNLAWIPAEKPKDILNPRDEYKVLRKPSEVILAKDYMIAGASYYTLSSKVRLGKKVGEREFSKRDMAQKIKLLVNLPTTSIFESFRRLRDIPTNNKENKISNYAKAFYKYIGRIAFSDEIPDDIKEKSIFIMGRWLPSNKVFQCPPDHLSGIFSWDDLVKSDGTDSVLAKGLIRIGVLDRPDNNYLLDYLNKIPQNKKLNGQQLKESKAILKHFQNNLEDLEVNDIPLISRSDQLVDCSDLYFKDSPAYDQSKKKNEQLKFCQKQFVRLAKYCDVVSLADSKTPQLDDEHSQESGIVNNNWNDYIRSEPFKLAVLRLIYHEGGISDDDIEPESIDKVLPSEVLLMDRLVVNYYINEIWIYDDVEASTYSDTENSILYLLNQDDEEDMCDSIAQFITKSSKLSSDSLLLIARILRKKLNTSEEIKNLLDNKNIKSLPEKIEIDDDISLFGDSSAPSNDLDDSASYDVEDEPLSENYNQEDQQPPSGNPQNGGTNLSENNETKESGNEIPPPIKPKQSGSQGIIGTSSGNHNSNTGNSDHNWHDHNANRGSQSGTGDNRGGGSNRQGNNKSKTRSNSTRNSVSPNNRMPVYVGKEKESDKERTDEEREFAKKIGNKGESYVLEHSKDYVFSSSNKFIKAVTDNNKGYDITEIDSNDEIVRYIEVKTLTGKWGEGGVGITESQLEFAQVYDNWWLFVVENINTEDTRIHILKNPVLQANRFMFDHSWKQLTISAEKVIKTNPRVGESYRLPGGVYKILTVDIMGKFFKVKLKHTQSNEAVTKKFDYSWEKC